MAAQPTKNPCYVAGTPRSSGDVQTGEVHTTYGGTRCLNGQFSGLAGGGSVLFSGAGRLKSVIQHQQLLSGLPVLIYDTAVFTSGGPFAASGHKIIGMIPGTYAAGAVSGAGFNAYTGVPMTMDMPFTSGICFTGASGQPGFTISFTPEVSNDFTNPAVT